MPAIPVAQVAQRPVDGFFQMAEVAGVGSVLLDERRLGRRENRVRAHQLVEPFINAGHVAIQAMIAGAAGRVVGMPAAHGRVAIILVAFQTPAVIPISSVTPGRSGSFVRIVTVKATELGITAAVPGIGELGGIPGIDAPGKPWSVSGVAARAD